MLKILPITLPKNYPLFLSYSHITTYYSHIVLFSLAVQVLIHHF